MLTTRDQLLIFFSRPTYQFRSCQCVLFLALTPNNGIRCKCVPKSERKLNEGVSQLSAQTRVGHV